VHGRVINRQRDISFCADKLPHNDHRPQDPLGSQGIPGGRGTVAAEATI
jgi:hypothetical protein